MGVLKRFQKAISTNSTSTAFTAQVPTTTVPSGIDLMTEVIREGRDSFRVPNLIQVVPFGTNGNNDTFDMRVFGWSATDDSTTVYMPQLLADVSVVLGNIDGAAIAADTFIADTLTVNDGAADNGPWRTVTDCQEDLPASFIVHTKGCRYITFDWDLAGGQEAVSMNAYWRSLDL